MAAISSEIYSEVYGILQMLGINYINKIPSKLYEQIEQQKNNEYNPTYNKDKSLTEQNVKKQSIAFIATLHLNFWTKSKEEKDRLYDIFNDNEKKRVEKYEKDIFEEQRNKIEANVEKARVANEVALIEKKETLFTKILNKIKSLFKK